MYSKEPHVALDAIYSLAIQGTSGAKFGTKSGGSVDLEAFSVKPSVGALNLVDPRSRSYASQLFQMLAANIVHQANGITYEFKKVPQTNGGYIRNDALFENIGGQRVASSQKTGFWPHEAEFAAREMGATAPMTIINPKSYPNFNTFEQAMTALRNEDFPALIVVDGNAIAKPSVLPARLNHTIPIFDVGDIGGKTTVDFQHNWGFALDPADRSLTMSLRNLWALSKPQVASKYWDPKDLP